MNDEQKRMRRNTEIANLTNNFVEENDMCEQDIEMAIKAMLRFVRYERVIVLCSETTHKYISLHNAGGRR